MDTKQDKSVEEEKEISDEITEGLDDKATETPKIEEQIEDKKAAEDENTEPVVTEERNEEIVEKKAERKKPEKDKDEEIAEEKIYTIPLQKAWLSPRKKRTPKTLRIIREFIQKHMKLKPKSIGEEEPSRLIISNEVNEKLWSRGIEKPPRKIKVRAVKDQEGKVTLYLAEGE